MTKLLLAMDRKTVRTIDSFGKMHIEISNISKAAVNPYLGSEIPNGVALGLDMGAAYMLLRAPEEIALGLGTFNNIPVLDRHIPVTAENPSKEFVVGSTGTDASFDEPYLRNSLVLWDAVAIAGVRTKQQCELSSAYSYTADMTPGIYEGVPYDGIMRNIKGNHVALVEVGRAGPDVVVGDSKLLEKPKMHKKLSANATAVRVAILACLPPLLAQDAQIGDLTAIVGGVKGLKTAKEQGAIVAKVTKHFKLAQDADLSPLVELLKVIGDEDPEDEDDADGKKKVALDADDEDEPPKKKVALDADEDDKIGKPAMDAAIATATSKVRAETIASMNAIHQAERDVEPFIGKLAIAQDSAENVYKLALDAAKIDLTGVHASAYRAMVTMLLRPGTTVATPVLIAQDAATGATGFAAMFPNAGKMKGGV